MSGFKPLPPAVPLRKLLGPSFIILALGFGSGEIILWPYLTSNFGLGLAWGALIGITCQFFINMEIERYALVKGESVFVGMHKLWPKIVWWFIISTFLGFGLPGIIAASAQVFSNLLGISNFKWLAVLLLIGCGILLNFGKTVYESMEKTTRLIIFIGLPFIIFLVFILTSSSDWVALGRGLVGWGDGYRFLPPGIALATFLGAFAYSGAGGNLNLTQSIYIREKGYGMGFYAQKISGLFKNIKEQQEIKLTGEDFEVTDDNIKKFNLWWKRINLEHALIFWLLGFLGICLLMLLSYVTTYGLLNNTQGISFVLNEGMAISTIINPVVSVLFLLVIAVMLWQTQLGILDSTSRIMAENFALNKIGQGGQINLSKMYYGFLWAQILFGIILFLFNIYEPRTLIVVGAVINAVAMFVHVGLVNFMNWRILPPAVRPKVWRRLLIGIIFILFGGFSVFTLWHQIGKIF